MVHTQGNAVDTECVLQVIGRAVHDWILGELNLERHAYPDHAKVLNAVKSHRGLWTSLLRLEEVGKANKGAAEWSKHLLWPLQQWVREVMTELEEKEAVDTPTELLSRDLRFQ